jgi:ribonucleoside-diphosphate reductase alpha subunit
MSVINFLKGSFSFARETENYLCVSMMSLLRVTKRNGELEPVQFEKVTNRIKFLCLGILRDGTKIGDPLDGVCYVTVAQKVIAQITDKITTSELDEDAARFCASKAKDHYHYGVLGGRIIASNHQKGTISNFSKTMQLLYENRKPDGSFYPLIDRRFYKFISRNGRKLDDMIDHARDYRLDYFGIMTLLGGPGKPGYVLCRHDAALNVAETPQHLYMRVAVCLHINDYRPLEQVLNSIKETYDMLSLGYYSHATPTMYNAGTHCQQLSSCFLLGIADTMDDENMDEDGSIPACWTACARISKRAGGIGIGLQPIRSRGTLIAGTGGTSDGIIPLVRVLNMIACYVNQGGRRPGAFALYEEPWCADIFAFLDLKKNTGLEEERARDLFYAMWIPDLFMKRLITAIEMGDNKRNVMWSLMCAHKCPGLYESYGDKFEELYENYEREGRYVRQVPIWDLWEAILVSQKETGGPYMLYKDHVNRKNAQANLGVIRNSNLCAEIVEYSDDQEYAVCNLASVALPSCVDVETQTFNYRRLYDICKVAYRRLDAVIDINYYPVRKCKRSNLRHRPVGLGVQGWGDVLLMLDLPFEDTVNEERKSAVINPKTRELNRKIAEVMYYACVEASIELAMAREQGMATLRALWLDDKIEFTDDGIDIASMDPGLSIETRRLIEELRPIEGELNRESHLGSYSSFIGSPAYEGKLQYHLWGVEPENWNLGEGTVLNWHELEQKVCSYGLRGSLFRANMPTASTSQILGNVEANEPYKYAIYTRRVTVGEFVVVNKHLHKELTELGLWTTEIQKQIIKDRGSVQNIKELPLRVRDKYRTAFEVSKKTIQILAAEQGPYIDQSNSQNYFIAQPTNKILTNVHIGAWKLGLKTGMYYLRRESNQQPVQFTVDGGLVVNEKKKGGDSGCVSCSA